MSSIYSSHADCLSSAVVTGKLCRIENISDISSFDSETIVWSEKLDTNEIIKLLKYDFIKGVIVKKGGFAGHASGFLNGRGIQLAVSSQFEPEKNDNSWIVLDGYKEMIYSYSQKPIIKIELNNISKIEHTENNYFQVFVDGKDDYELEMGLKNGANGIGILKTDWMNWNEEAPPSIESQVYLYNKCIAAANHKRLNLRLFDVGGDKIPKWAEFAHEYINSPIGFRGIRAMEIIKEAYDNQIKAISEVIKYHEIGVVLPMVTDISEVKTLKKYFQKVAGRWTKNIVWGIMVEIPEAALNIRELLRESDFIRIGPGDLSQACLAMCRDNMAPKYYSRNNLSPGVLKLIKMAAKECKIQHKEINICQDVEPCKKLIKEIISSGVSNFCVSYSCVSNLRKIIGEVS